MGRLTAGRALGAFVLSVDWALLCVPGLRGCRASAHVSKEGAQGHSAPGQPCPERASLPLRFFALASRGVSGLPERIPDRFSGESRPESLGTLLGKCHLCKTTDNRTRSQEGNCSAGGQLPFPREWGGEPASVTLITVGHGRPDGPAQHGKLSTRYLIIFINLECAYLLLPKTAEHGRAGPRSAGSHWAGEQLRAIASRRPPSPQFETKTTGLRTAGGGAVGVDAPLPPWLKTHPREHSVRQPCAQFD